MRLAATPKNLSVIQVYTPTIMYAYVCILRMYAYWPDDEVKVEALFNQPENTVSKIRRKNIKIIQGTIGSDAHTVMQKKNKRLNGN